jgi:hypothetical protein
MKAHQVESWVLGIIDRVKAGQPVEDSRVELKSEWIAPEKAARRIAGHANAARGARILWIIGLDEDRGVTGAKREELANWYPRVESHFDGLAPGMISYSVPTGDDTVVALLFETERVPFVVSNPCFGRQGGGAVAREVPWREGTRVRSAKREDLLRLLSPLQVLPDIEVLDGLLAAEWRGPDDDVCLSWSLALTLYVVPRGDQRIVIPFHKCESKFAVSEDVGWTTLEGLRLYPPQVAHGPTIRGVTPKLSETIRGTPDEVLIHGPGKLHLRAVLDTKAVEHVADEAQAWVSLLPTDVDVPVVIDVRMSQCTSDGREALKWCYESGR